MPSDVIRAMRGALRNAALWGVAWGAAGLVLWAGLRVLGLIPPEAGVRAAAFLAVRLGVAGGVAALAFSAVVRLAYRGRRLQEINWVKGGLLAGLVTGLAFPLFLQAMNLLSGDGLIAWSLVLDDGPIVGVLAAVAAGGTLKLAQRMDALAPDSPDQALDAGSRDSSLDHPAYLESVPPPRHPARRV